MAHFGLRASDTGHGCASSGWSPRNTCGKPLIVILNTWSELNPCHMHLRQRAEQVKRGVLQAGGFPVEMPVATWSETFRKPSPMIYGTCSRWRPRSCCAAYPADGAVLMGGCDNDHARAADGRGQRDIPAIYVTAGPMLAATSAASRWAADDAWKFWDDARRGHRRCELADLKCGIAGRRGIA